jgi:hypothetical protein
MKARIFVSLFAATLFPLAALAHDCSGGKDGGMDATGNQCNSEQVVTAAPSEAAASTQQPGVARAKAKERVVRANAEQTAANGPLRKRARQG